MSSIGLDIEKEELSLERMGAMRCVTDEFDWFRGATLPYDEADPDAGLAQRFFQAAKRFPDNFAIKTPEQSHTYSQLAGQVAAVAAQVISITSSAEGPVLIGTSDPVRYIIGILGILATGHYYVTIRHDLPESRKKAVINQIGAAPFLLTGPADRLSENSALRFIDIAHCSSDWPTEGDFLRKPSPYAFVQFTSGTTGVPKGVVQTQKNILRNVVAQVDSLRISSRDSFSQLHPEGTMGATRAIFNALLNGATLCPYSVGENELGRLLSWIKLAQPSVLHCSASLFRLLAGMSAASETFQSVRLMILGGEAVFQDDLALFSKIFAENSLLCVGLGSTETTTVRMMLLPQSAQPETYLRRLPIGFSVRGMSLTIIDREDTEDEAASDKGYICVSADEPFFGYWPLLPKVDSPSMQSHNMGDRAHISESGVLFHAGRKAGILKLNGQKVDLAEIENVARSVKGVADFAFVTENDSTGDDHLTMFVVPTHPTALTLYKLDYYFRKFLPKAARPARIYFIESLPRGTSGKADLGKLRKMLEDSSGSAQSQKLMESYINETPRHLRKLLKCFLGTSSRGLERWLSWQNSLPKVRRISFEEIGFDSLEIFEVCLNIETKFGIQISEEKLFELERMGMLGQYVREQLQ